MKEKKAVKKILDDVPLEKRKLYTGVIWLFTVMSYLLFCFYDELSVLFYITFLPLAGVAFYDDKKFFLLMFPKSFRRWILESRIMVACRGPLKDGLPQKFNKLTWRQQVPCALFVSNLFPVIVLLALSSMFYTPILDLDELDMYRGYVESANFSRGRRSSGATLLLRTVAGKAIKFVSVGSRDDIEYLKALQANDIITVWCQDKWLLVPPNIRKKVVRQLEHNGHFLKKYDKGIRLRNAPIWKNIWYTLFLYVVVTMAFVWMKGNSYLKEKK